MNETNAQVSEILAALQKHPDGEYYCEALGEAVLNELDLNPSDLAEAIIKNDTNDFMTAITGWCIQSILAKAKIIPDSRHYFYSAEEQKNMRTAFRKAPWELDGKDEAQFAQYAKQLCPHCGSEVVIYANGLTYCPACREKIFHRNTVCASCKVCKHPCPATESNLGAAATISPWEIEWFENNGGV